MSTEVRPDDPEIMCFRLPIVRLPNINARPRPWIEMVWPRQHHSMQSFHASHNSVPLWLLVLVSRNQILNICVLLVIPSKTHVLSMGIYCLVMILITSCATMPPVKAEILCSSPPLARATSSAA